MMPCVNRVKHILQRTAIAACILATYSAWSQAPERLSVGQHLAQINGVSIGYCVAGEGPILVIQAPGWGVGSTYLQRTLAPLEHRLTLVYVDPRGSGRSSRPADPTHMSTIDMEEDLEGEWRTLEIDEAGSVGDR
jgi:proline iminopeptidase